MPTPRAALPQHSKTVKHEIRLLFNTGEMTQAQLCRKYELSQSHVSAIVLRKTWKTIDDVEYPSYD